jgi:D-alanyl-lipoteichoic acid acyltransferase DltB (MBOAT superfamily)
MLFNTPAFAVFLALTVTLVWALESRPRARIGVLLGASYYFYACWDVRFLLLIGGVTLLDWAGGLALVRLPSGRPRTVALALLVGVNLGLVGFWKYVGFFAHALAPVSLWLGLPPPPAVSLLLPVGISFFTFEGVSYLVDVYRGDIPPERSLPRFALFIAFFPHLVAGPIVRAGQLIPALVSPSPIDDERFGRGLFLIIGGLAKKVVLADYLATHLVDRVFDLPSHYSSLEALAAIYGYALQIYGDFSGYSDIAIGCALLLGVEIPDNFNQPYRADGLRDFWRRWHISLSTWLRDYLYVTLGGSRGGRLQTQRNLLVTMVLGGLWHGAAYTFLLWGLMHGLLLAVGRVLPEGVQRVPRWLRVGVTFHFVAILWVFFRAETFGGALEVLGQVVALVPGTANLSAALLALIAAGFALQWLPLDLYRRVAREFVRAPALAQAAATIAVLYAIGEVAATGAAPFIYFQF